MSQSGAKIAENLGDKKPSSAAPDITQVNSHLESQSSSGNILLGGAPSHFPVSWQSDHFIDKVGQRVMRVAGITPILFPHLIDKLVKSPANFYELFLVFALYTHH